MGFLSGKKTIIGTILLGIVGVLASLGYLTAEQAEAIISVVGVFTGVSAVLHVNKLKQ